jgi:hypothetical protein
MTEEAKKTLDFAKEYFFSIISHLVRYIIIFVLVFGCAKTMSAFLGLAKGSGILKPSSITERVITAPSGEIVSSVSGVLKLLIAPSTNGATAPQGTDAKSSDVVLLPVERTEHSPVVLPYIASLTACVIVICAFIWGIVRVWRED